MHPPALVDLHTTCSQQEDAKRNIRSSNRETQTILSPFFQTLRKNRDPFIWTGEFGEEHFNSPDLFATLFTRDLNVIHHDNVLPNKTCSAQQWSSFEKSFHQGIVGCTPTNVPLCEIPI